MSLTRGLILGYNNQCMTFGFTMFNDGEVIEFAISAAAMDDLVGGARGTLTDREAQFLRLREAIESIASAKFHSGTLIRGSAVRIFAKDIRK